MSKPELYPIMWGNWTDDGETHYFDVDCKGQLYWDKKPVVVRRKVRLGTFERWVAILGLIATFGRVAMALWANLKS